MDYRTWYINEIVLRAYKNKSLNCVKLYYHVKEKRYPNVNVAEAKYVVYEGLKYLYKNNLVTDDDKDLNNALKIKFITKEQYEEICSIRDNK